MFKDLARMTVAMNQTFLEEQEVIRVTNSFVAVRRDDLTGEFDFDMDISTPERDNETAQKLTMLLQTNAATMNPAVMHKMYKKLAMLWKMPDLAKDLGEYTPPEPHPMEEEMRKLQMENARLENIKLKKSIEELDSRISERVSRSVENESDVRTKESQSDLRAAQARKIASEADLNDQAFLEAHDGTDVQKKMAMNAQQHEANIQAQSAAAEHRRLSKLDELAFKHEVEKDRSVGNHLRNKDLEVHKNALTSGSGKQETEMPSTSVPMEPISINQSEGNE